MPKSAAFFVKRVTVFKTSLGAVTAAHTTGESRWKLCVTWLLPIAVWLESGWGQVAKGALVAGVPMASTPLRKAHQVSSTS